MTRLPPCSTLFPYTTLFRSGRDREALEAKSRFRPRHVGRIRPQEAGGMAPHRRERARSPEGARSEEHTSELQSQSNLVCRLLLEKKNTVEAHAALSLDAPES